MHSSGPTSALTDEHATSTARDLGALAVWVKPFDCKRVLSLILTLPESS